ncbi:MAG: ACP phosphodiesterase [Planctomycetota bacterium]
MIPGLNFLAHLLLADDNAASMVGNILPDLHRGRLPDDLDPVVFAGVLRHRRVDAYTDRHPVFERSRARLRSAHGRFAGVIVDVLYDHTLSVRWDRHHPRPRAEFVRRVYGTLAEPAAVDLMTPRMRTIMPFIAEEDWLNAYATVDGIALTLERMSARLRKRFGRPVDLAPAADTLREQYGGFLADFDEFFPDLRAHVDANEQG